jgi:hypothetical protein
MERTGRRREGYGLTLISEPVTEGMTERRLSVVSTSFSTAPGTTSLC